MRAFKVAPQGREPKSLAISIKQMLVVGGLFSFAFPHTGHLKEIRVCPSRLQDSFDSVHDVLESHLLKL